MNRAKQVIHAKRVYEYGYSGKGVTIAILDSGVSRHKDLEENRMAFHDFVNHRLQPYDDHGHGTHVTGICCGRQGIAPGANYVSLKVLDQDGNGKTRDVLDALAWIKENQDQYNIRIVNFSVGFVPGAARKEQTKLLDAFERMWDDGLVVVTAAGNMGPGENTVTIPGISRKVITVGACDVMNYGYEMYSGEGPTQCCIVKPEILAPGSDILSCDNKGSGYRLRSGTSMAAPMVSGAIALGMEKHPGYLPEQWKLRLFQSVSEMQAAGRRRCWGILHVDNLLELS